MSDTGHWANRQEAGFFLGMRLMFFCYRVLGAPAFKLILFPVLLYFFLFNRGARQSSLDYTQRLLRSHPELALRPGWQLSFSHFNQFVAAIIDKLDAWIGAIPRESVVFHGRERFMALLEQRQGAVLLGSHLGNLEVCRALADLNPDLRLNVLVHTKHAGKFNRLLEQFSSRRKMELIQVTELDPAMAIMLNERIQRGEVIVIVGDRIPVDGKKRTVPASFLGDIAPFPQGPFILASLLKCPVYTLFCLKNAAHFDIYLDHFADRVILPRESRHSALAAYAQRFAEQLEYYCTVAPLQWFNFYPFWFDAESPTEQM